MAKITKEKYLKINEGCANGFKLDLQYYVCYGEYALEKYDLMQDNIYKKYRLSFRQHYDYIVNEYGCKYPKYDGTYDIYLNINTSRREDKVIITEGLGKDILLEKGVTRKTIKKLQEWSSNLDIESLEV